MRANPLTVGEPAPWFTAASPIKPQFHFDTVAGRYVVLCFFGSASAENSRRVLHEVLQQRQRFDDETCSFFGISIDPEDERSGRVQEQLPGLHVFWDFDLAVSKLYGVTTATTPGPQGSYRPMTLLLDTRLRVLAVLPFGDHVEGHVPRLLELLASLPPLGPVAPASVQAPVLIVPRIFEPELCQLLIRYYDDRGGEDSGFMRDIDGQTVGVYDYAHKRRRDQEILDDRLRAACMHRVHDRLAPEIARAFQFQVTRIERFIVSCYEAETGGHFAAHRDNTTLATAHRRFAVTLNLNTGDYEGGCLRFPEYGAQTYEPPAGAALVFSCALLHEATPVRRGKRYVFLPFLYDDAAARIREMNLRFLAGGKSTM